MCSLKLLANHQLGGDSLVEVLVEGLQERSRLKMMGDLRKSSRLDNHEAETSGDLERTMVSLPAVEPKFSKDCPDAAVREGAEELTPRSPI